MKPTLMMSQNGKAIRQTVSDELQTTDKQKDEISQSVTDEFGYRMAINNICTRSNVQLTTQRNDLPIR